MEIDIDIPLLEEQIKNLCSYQILDQYTAEQAMLDGIINLLGDIAEDLKINGTTILRSIKS